MMKRVSAEWPASPRTEEAKKIAIVYAVILVVMTTAQLFSFEKFIPLIDDFELPGRLVAFVLAVCGVFALPFLLRMKVSRGLRWASMIAGWIVAGVWLFLGVWMNVVTSGGGNAGLLGASVELVSGWWVVFVALGFAILAAWSAWGLWPGKRSSLEPRRKK